MKKTTHYFSISLFFGKKNKIYFKESTTSTASPSPSVTRSTSPTISTSQKMKRPIPLKHKSVEYSHCPRNCSNHGACILGICICDVTPDERYDGEYCSQKVKRCPDDCTAQGNCNTTNGVCTCFAGWSGPSCNKTVCLFLLINIFS